MGFVWGLTDLAVPDRVYGLSLQRQLPFLKHYNASMMVDLRTESDSAFDSAVDTSELSLRLRYRF
eukprot:1156784-Pelagomonas_calceolata.AAC.3